MFSLLVLIFIVWCLYYTHSLLDGQPTVDFISICTEATPGILSRRPIAVLNQVIVVVEVVFMLKDAEQHPELLCTRCQLGLPAVTARNVLDLSNHTLEANCLPPTPLPLYPHQNHWSHLACNTHRCFHFWKAKNLTPFYLFQIYDLLWSLLLSCLFPPIK